MTTGGHKTLSYNRVVVRLVAGFQQEGPIHDRPFLRIWGEGN